MDFCSILHGLQIAEYSLRLAEIECAVKPEQWYEDSRDIDKVSGKAHPWNIDIEESILNEADR